MNLFGERIDPEYSLGYRTATSVRLSVPISKDLP
jgi:hypothetical protein